MLITAEGANRSEAWLKCKYHPEPGRPAKASSWEQLGYNEVQRVALHGVVATESKVLPYPFGGTDLLFPVHRSSGPIYWVAVEVDGETHFGVKPWNAQRAQQRQQQEQQQRQRDAAKDAAAWEQRQSVVRLHHSDTAEWRYALEMARWLACQECLFTLYTPSYEYQARFTRLQYKHAPTPTLQTWAQVRTL